MSIGSDLLRFSNKKIVLFDLETRNLNLMLDNMPFQCSWIVADRYKIIERHNYYLKWPNYKISKGAAMITGFNPRWVLEGTDPRFVLDTFNSYVLDPEYIVAGHNILSFDSAVWRQWCKELRVSVDQYALLERIVDTNLLARAYKEGWKPDRANFLSWQYKVMGAFRKGVKTNLTLMATELGIPFDESKLHDAMEDLMVNYEVYKKLINLVEV